MQLRSTHLILLLLTCCFSSYAQYENKWYFGQRCVLDFSSGAPVFDTSSIVQLDNFADASVCDANGNFLFYTNGNQVWSLDTAGITTLMPNGTNGMTGPSQFPNVAKNNTQGALIVPMPGASGKYYVFSLTWYDVQSGAFDSLTVNTLGHRLYYSVVDMSLNNGMGDVVAEQKSILVDSNLRSGMVSIMGDNCNIWVIVSDFKIPAFKAFEITSEGVNMDPVISSVGIGGHPAASKGMLAAAPNRSKLAATQDGGTYGLQSWYDTAVYGNDYGQTAAGLYDFDPATGLVSNPINLIHYLTPAAYANLGSATMTSPDSLAYSVCFSPDNSKLYVSSNEKMYQYDISLANAADIIASRTLLGALGYNVGIRLGPDQKIYFISNYQIGCIESPNLAGIACSFNPDAVLLNFDEDDFPFFEWPMLGYGLPNVISVIEPSDTVYSTQTIAFCGIDTGTLVALELSSGGNYVWSTGAASDSLSVTVGGDYWVSYITSGCTLRVDTFSVSFGSLGTPPVITADGHDLSTTAAYDTYQWLLNGAILPGAINAIYTVTENGDYSVVVGDAGGCGDTSAAYTVSDITGIAGMQAIAKQIRVYPNPSVADIHIQAPVPVDLHLVDLSGRSLISARDAGTLSLDALARGTYLLYILNRQGALIKVEKIVKR